MSTVFSVGGAVAPGLRRESRGGGGCGGMFNVRQRIALLFVRCCRDQPGAGKKGGGWHCNADHQMRREKGGREGGREELAALQKAAFLVRGRFRDSLLVWRKSRRLRNREKQEKE